MIDVQRVAKTAQGDDILLLTLQNNGIVVQLLSLGAIVKTIKTADRNGEVRDIVLGFDNPLDNLTSTAYFGQVVGRYANRIGGASFTLDGEAHFVGQRWGTPCTKGLELGWQNWCTRHSCMKRTRGRHDSGPAGQGGSRGELHRHLSAQ